MKLCNSVGLIAMKFSRTFASMSCPKRTVLYRFYLLLLLCCGQILQAQVVEEPELFNGSLSFYPWTDYSPGTDRNATGEPLLAEFVYFDASGKAAELSLRPHRLHKSFSYRGPANLMLYPKGTVIVEGVPLPRPIAQVSLNTQSDQAVIFLRGQGKSFKAFDAFAINGSSFELKPGNVRFFNLSNRRLLMKVGDGELEPFFVSAYGTASIDVADFEKSNLPIYVATEFQQKEGPGLEAKIVLSTIRAFSPTRPSLILLMPKSETSQSYRMISLMM